MDNYLIISKQFFNSLFKNYRNQIKNCYSAVLSFKRQILQKYQLQNLLSSGGEISFNAQVQFERLLGNKQFTDFFYKQLGTLRRSVKEILKLFEIPYQKELNQYEIEKQQKIENNEDIDEVEQQFEENKKQIRNKLLQQCIDSWLYEKNSQMILFFVELLEYIYICTNYCWEIEGQTMPIYNDFNLPLKTFLIIYEFLYPESADNQYKTNEDYNKDTPELSKLQTKDTHSNIENNAYLQQATSFNNDLTKSVSQVINQKQQIDINTVELKDFYSLLQTQFINLVAFFVNNNFSTQGRNRWIKLLNSVVGTKKLDLQMKLNYLKAVSTSWAKDMLKLYPQKDTLNVNESDEDEYDEEEFAIQNTIIIKCERDQIWDTSLSSIIKFSPYKFATNPLEIQFKGEDGIDAGGLSREWFSLVVKDIIDPSKGLFQASSNGITMQPNPFSVLVPNYINHFRFFGRVVGKLLVEKIDVELDLTKSFLKHILGKPLYISDLEDIDPDEAKNLIWMIDNDVSELYLSFTISTSFQGIDETIELMPNGKNIDITEDNKKEYVKAVCKYKMTDCIKDQITAFQQGFYEIVPKKALKLLDEKELGIHLAGVKKIDINDMRKNMTYNGYTNESMQIEWFWEVMEEYDDQLRSLFIFFVTGTFKVPFGGFKNFRLEIANFGNEKQLPVSHTCSKSLDLPEYKDKQILKQKLTLAITMGSQGFHIG